VKHFGLLDSVLATLHISLVGYSTIICPFYYTFQLDSFTTKISTLYSSWLSDCFCRVLRTGIKLPGKKSEKGILTDFERLSEQYVFVHFYPLEDEKRGLLLCTSAPSLQC
jgi:hypothetical protein